MIAGQRIGEGCFQLLKIVDGDLPRLLAGQADLPPITALLAMYVGFRFMGVGGMILLPIVLLLLKQFQDAGVIRLWK